MLEIDVVMATAYDEEKNEFSTTDSVHVCLEHSLVSMSKWESLWEIPFLGKEEKSTEQTISYVEMMILGEKLPPAVFLKLLQDHMEQIKNYIEAKMTATFVPEIKNSSGRPETITSELIYYWMISMQIPVQFEHWHLNRLIMLIRVVSFKNAPKSSRRRMTAAERAALNRQRLAQHNTRG